MTAAYSHVPGTGPPQHVEIRGEKAITESGTLEAKSSKWSRSLRTSGMGGMQMRIRKD